MQFHIKTPIWVQLHLESGRIAVYVGVSNKEIVRLLFFDKSADYAESCRTGFFFYLLFTTL